MNCFDWAVRFTVENYHPKGRKKGNGQQSIVFEAEDCDNTCLLDTIFFNLKVLVLSVNLNIIFLHSDIKVFWFKLSMLLKRPLESQGPTPSLRHLRTSEVETVYQDGY